MVKKLCGLILAVLLALPVTVFGAGLKREYKFQFEGWKEIKPTHICSLMDVVIVMQNAQAKIKNGANPATVPIFEGEIPSPNLKKERGSAKPADVAKMMIKALETFETKTGKDVTIPALPTRKIYPADVLVYTSIAFDSLGQYLEEKGLRKIGDFSLLRYRYPNRLKPHD